ncbi:C4-dicarboxylate TRAP transporter large permease protein DctM [Koleobacter methoxysyntrophicus]|uniref:C4-dicarboxylate TRAP transporter large permease protein DctM n=1 Tax=Koleobacter methoxysyntrophicus TaxID=2751313 RepID=A0A8A0RP33_9FIRM|nr:TRAP transporter permease [Koleobacter methoxysyntrophicus]QSQ09177.1 C4-dicarboxylate TRAP transporter large permease protein DctM [Koleobacter methoxysyntrophicus]
MKTEDIKQAREETGRKLTGKIALIATMIAVFTSFFHVWMNSLSLMIAIKRNALHLGFMLCLAFLLYPASRKSPKDRPSLLDIILSILGLSVGLYIYLFFDSIVDRSLIPNTTDYVFAILAIILTLEGGRRTVGPILPVLSILFILYAKFGYIFPGALGHPGFSWQRILTRMYLTDEGIFGVTLMVSSSYVFMFILFGAFLSKTGTAGFFNDFALAFAGRMRGGPAQVAVMASGMMGTISGSSQANVATTGSFTIPLMKQVGYTPFFAGAVEAAASTGGILMPPIMGASSFIMASFLGIPYLKVMYAGIIPALFYYFAIFVMVDLEARKLGLKGLPAGELPGLKMVLKERGHLIIPIIVILIFLVKGYTPLYAANFGLIATIVTSMFRKNTRMSLKKFLDAMEEGAKTAISVATACAVVGFIVGVVSMTGIGQVIAHNIISLSMNQLWLALILVMISSIILGMGLPATACYIITASIAAPALVKMGVLPIAAHFFAFYYGTLSAVIPPVALTSYTAAGLAGANPTKVAFTGLKLAFAGLIIPFMFVYSPILLMENLETGRLILALITGITGIICLGIAGENYLFERLKIYERIPFFIAAISLVKPGKTTDLIGIIFLGIGLIVHVLRTKQRRRRLTVRQ